MLCKRITKLFLGVIILLAAVIAPYMAYADNYPKNLNIDIKHYAFSLTLSESTDVIKTKANITFLLKKENIRQLRLDLVNKKEIDGKGMLVLKVESNGILLKYIHKDDVLLVDLTSISTNIDHSVTIEYEGIPRDGMFIGPNKYGDRSFFSDNWPNKAKNWLVTVDHPYDKATSEFLVTAPLKYQVVSNGLKIEESNVGNGMRLTHWKQSVPISCWLYVLGVAEFAMQHVDDFKGKPIETWVYKQDRIPGFYDFATPTKQVLAYYSDYVGPFAYERLANIQSHSAGGGMESASAILYNEKSVVGDRNERWRNVVIHEIAHQWFGNTVTEYDWNDVWLSEGFATYFTMRFIKHAYGDAVFVKELVKSRRDIFKMSENNDDYRIVHSNLTDMSKVTSGLTYQKGAWILNMLCNYIGEENFQKGIRDYYQRYFNGTATTENLRMAFERASGKDLKQFFNQWLYQGGNIKLEGNWKYNAKAKMIEIELKQLQPEKYNFIMPLEIGIALKDKSKQKIEMVKLNKRVVKVSIPSETLPLDIVLDPKTKLLATWNFTKQN